jgi:hypothetical protein
MQKDLKRPIVEEPKESYGFEFLALWNTYAAIANSIAMMEHGGSLIIVPPNAVLPEKYVRIKYKQNSHVLRSAFVDFMNKRHILGDLMARRESGELVSDEPYFRADVESRLVFSQLVEATRFVAQLSGCDGAVIMTDDLRIRGFGAEIRAELRKGKQIFEAIDDYDEFNREYRPLDIEQFGMRHRSAIKLISRMPRARAIVISYKCSMD